MAAFPAGNIMVLRSLLGFESGTTENAVLAALLNRTLALWTGENLGVHRSAAVGARHPIGADPALALGTCGHASLPGRWINHQVPFTLRAPI